ncbi:MAG: hypothetical protein AABX93_03295 [Nanoarchaeota archaeon]
MRESTIFDSVVAGGYEGDFNCYYKLIDLNLIPEDLTKITAIDDKSFIYVLFGRTKNFQSYERTKIERVNSIYMSFIGNLRGDIYDSDERLVEHSILNLPQAIFAGDGRIFLEKNILDKEELLAKIPKLVQIAGKFFKRFDANVPTKNLIPLN